MYEKFEQLLQIKGVSAYKVAKETGINQQTFSKWKNGISTPKTDKLQKIADYFGVSMDYLLGRTTNHYSNETTILKNKQEGECVMNNTVGFDFNNISEAQRAMLKYRLGSLLMEKYQNQSFWYDEHFCKSINSTPEQARLWFNNVNNYALHDKIDIMLNLIGISKENLFDDMVIIIANKNEAIVLNLDEIYDEEKYPILISGSKIFNKLKNFTVANLKALDEKISSQLMIENNSTIVENKSEINGEMKQMLKDNKYTSKQNEEYDINRYAKIAAEGGEQTRADFEEEPKITN